VEVVGHGVQDLHGLVKTLEFVVGVVFLEVDRVEVVVYA